MAAACYITLLCLLWPYGHLSCCGFNKRLLINTVFSDKRDSQCVQFKGTVHPHGTKVHVLGAPTAETLLCLPEHRNMLDTCLKESYNSSRNTISNKSRISCPLHHIL